MFGRPTPEMHDHHTHDLSLIAGLAADDLSGADRSRAQAVLDRCSECTAIHADLITIAAATRALPKRARAPRDFRISAEQAARLHRRSWLRTFLAPFAGSGSAARPIATAFTSLGLVGLLVVTILPGMLGGAASMAPQRESTGGAAAQASAGAGALAAPTAAAAAPTAAPAGPFDVAAASTVPAAVVPGKNGSTASGRPDAAFGANDNLSSPAAPVDAGQGSPESTPLPSPTPGNPLLLGSLALLTIGLGLFALRFAGRRLR